MELRPLALAVLVCAFSSATCSSTSSSVTAPAVVKCQISIGNQPASTFPANGGSGSISISTTRDCAWSASADAGWVSLATTSGQGDGTVAFTVAANAVPSLRSCGIVIADERVLVSQAAAACRFDLSRSRDTVGADGGRLSVAVATLSGCAWSASSPANWIAIESGQSGNGNGTVGLSVTSNTGPQRAGQVSIAGQTYSVVQDAAPSVPGPTPAPAPTPTPPAPAPTPAPTPTPPPPAPNPQPPPTAPPPPSTTVRLSGSVSSISGRCPNLTFAIGRTKIATDSSTAYSNGECGDLKNKKKVTVTGIEQDAKVRATRIELQPATDEH